MAYGEQLESGWVWHKDMVIPEKIRDKLVEEHVQRREEERRQQAAKDDAAFGLLESELSSNKSATKWLCPLEEYEGPALKLLNRHEVDEVWETLKSRYADSDRRDQVKQLIKFLRERGEYRKLARLPKDWSHMLDRMLVMFPNFAEVIRYIRAMFVLADHGDGVPRLDPLLLNGPPGVGKTYFAEYFASQLQCGFMSLRMENAQCNSQLSGSSEFWSNSKPGELFCWLVEKENANPVFFLDEIDKISSDDRYNPMSSLYSLFEPGTAVAFRDLSIPWLILDASRVIWIATSNLADNLPSPILNRVKRFDIAMPTPRQARRLVLQIFYRLRQEHFQALSGIRPSFQTVTLLADQPPRIIRQLLREAASRTLMRKGQRIEPNDFVLHVQDTQRRAIGFID